MADEEKDVAMVAEDEVVEKSLSDDLNDTWDVLEESPGEQEEAKTETAKVGEEPAEESIEAKPAETGDPATGDKAEPGAKAEPAAAAEAAKPPIDWNPELREQWGSLPDGVKSKIAERENQMAQAMQGTAQARQIAHQMGGIAQQYGSVMAAEGAQDPMQMFGALMQTVAELRMGTPQQKAQRLAGLVNHYGIGIEDLDTALAAQYGGEAAEQVQQQSQLEQLLDQKLAPVQQFMQRQQQQTYQQQMASQQSAVAEVDQFATTAEFLPDVRHDMADLIDLATRQGREMSIKEAYDKACAMNPQIAGVLDQRRQQEELVNAQKSVASKKSAASSLKPGAIGANTSPGNETITSALNAAWDDQIGR